MELTPSPLTLHRNYRYAIQLRACQHKALEAILDSQRLLYNAALQERCDAYAKAKKSISYIDQTKSLTAVRADDPQGYGGVPVNLCRGTLKRLDNAMQSFFRRVKAGQTPGFPRFKPMSRWSSFGFTEMAGIRLSGDHKSLQIKGVPGHIRLRLHREFPAGAVPKSAIFTKGAKCWYVSFLLAIPAGNTAAEWLPIEHDQRPDIGIDVGIESFLTTSEGEQIAGPSYGASAACTHRRLARAVSRKRRGSRGRKAAKAALARHSEHVANRRKHHAHVLSNALAMMYRVIAVEDLSITNMTRSAAGTTEDPGSKVKQKSGLNRSILDQGWGDFLTKLTYKAESAGGRVIAVKPHGTSQGCSACGATVPKALSVRIHRCNQCGLELHRDHNAARNILFRAAREDRFPGRLQSSGCSAAMPPEKTFLKPTYLATMAAAG